MTGPKRTNRFNGKSNLFSILKLAPKLTQIDGIQLSCRTWRKRLMSTYVTIRQLQ